MLGRKKGGRVCLSCLEEEGRVDAADRYFIIYC